MTRIEINLNESDYHRVEAIGSSLIKDLIKSPQAFWYNSWLNRDKVESDSASMAMGRAMHKYLLEPEKFAEEYVVLPCNKQINRDQPAWLAYQSSGDFNPAEWKITPKLAKYDGGRKVLKESLRVAIEQLKDSKLAKLYQMGLAEVSMFWEEEGVPCCGRLDYVQVAKINGELTTRIVDYKTIRGASKYIIGNNILDYGYDIQKVHYLSGLRAIKKAYAEGTLEIEGGTEQQIEQLKALLTTDAEAFSFVFQESAAPFDLAYIELAEDMTEQAERLRQIGFDRFTNYMQNYGEQEPWHNNYIGEYIFDSTDYGKKYEYDRLLVGVDNV